MSKRKSPVRHNVRSYQKADGVVVAKYPRGHGNPATEHRDYKIPNYLGGYRSANLREYADFLKASLHGDLVVEKHPSAVSLSLITVKRNDLDWFESSRPDFRESVDYWKDKIQRGETIEPILVHKIPNGRMIILDGNARIQAYKECGISSYPAVENGIFDTVKAKIGSGMAKVENYGHEVSSRAASGVAEYGHEYAKGKAYDIKESAAQTREDIKEGVSEAFSGFKERGKENLLRALQSGRVKTLLKNAASNDSYVSTMAKQELRSHYPLVWENSPYAEKTSIVRHENVQAKGYKEEIAERKEAQEKAQIAKGLRDADRRLYVTGTMEKPGLPARPLNVEFENKASDRLRIEARTKAEQQNLANLVEKGASPSQTPEEKKAMMLDKAISIAKRLKEMREKTGK